MSFQNEVDKLINAEEYIVLNKYNSSNSYKYFEQKKSFNTNSNFKENQNTNYRANTNQIRAIKAGAFSRLVAFMIDALIGNLLNEVFTKFVGQTGFLNDNSWVISFVIYLILTTYITNGQSLGKMAMGIRIIHKKEKKLSFLTTLIREGVCMFFLLKLPILFITLLFSSKNHSLADYFSDTEVIKDKYFEKIK